jgi:RimJ/RimL family protein N-acetyltransferase
VKLYTIDGVANSKELLYKLLNERDVNISSREMLSWDYHCAFVDSSPYEEWYILVSDEGYAVGAMYLTRMNEIGVQIFKAAQRKGYARAALSHLMERHKGKRLLANINPMDEPSIKLFVSMGFSIIQVTMGYSCDH